MYIRWYSSTRALGSTNRRIREGLAALLLALTGTPALAALPTEGVEAEVGLSTVNYLSPTAASRQSILSTLNISAKGFERVDFYFTVRKWKGTPKNMEPGKCDDLNWFALNGLPENTNEKVRQALQCIVKKISYSEYGWI